MFKNQSHPIEFVSNPTVITMLASRNYVHTALQRSGRSFVRFSSTGLTKSKQKKNPAASQAPNRETTWSPSQESRADAIARFPFKFVQRDLEQQPRPYAAIDLIAKEPVRYLSEGNVAVCDGNRGQLVQGHPKVFINLDRPEASACGYCGLRYAKEEHREVIEASEK